MTEKTPNLALDLLVSAQAQKHVTVNEALARIDAATQLAVLDRDLAAPPAAPADGDRYLVAVPPTGAWSGHDGDIAAWDGAAMGWTFLTPHVGWRLWIADEDTLVVFTDDGWRAVGGGSDDTALNPASVGVNTTADSTNRLAVKSEAALFTHDDADPGTGDMRLTLNKAAPAADTSLTLQTAYSTRAQIGLTGDDDTHLKVSPDGTTFHEAMIVDHADGTVRFPANEAQFNRLTYMGNFTVSSLGGLKRFNLRLKGLDVTRPAAFYVQIQGYAYGSGRALDMVFTGYNYPPTTSTVIKTHFLDRANTGLAMGATKTSSSVYVWFEANEYHTNGGVYASKVNPGASFDPSAGFDFIKTDAGVAVT